MLNLLVSAPKGIVNMANNDKGGLIRRILVPHNVQQVALH